MFVNKESTYLLTYLLTYAVVTTTVRLPFNCNSTALRPFDDVRYDRIDTEAQIDKWVSVTAD